MHTTPKALMHSKGVNEHCIKALHTHCIKVFMHTLSEVLKHSVSKVLMHTVSKALIHIVSKVFMHTTSKVLMPTISKALCHALLSEFSMQTVPMVLNMKDINAHNFIKGLNAHCADSYISNAWFTSSSMCVWPCDCRNNSFIICFGEYCRLKKTYMEISWKIMQ